ncbi:MAG: hypothetical protein DHS20C15_09830 [Planctomycetota bacterium]|nr:MAG: hypothetical protein DHS20C15_09830 [Planctomycetota bacterium]
MGAPAPECLMAADLNKELLSALNRIADSLEILAAAVDADEEEFNVYVRGEVDVDVAEDEEDEDDEEEDDDED